MHSVMRLARGALRSLTEGDDISITERNVDTPAFLSSTSVQDDTVDALGRATAWQRFAYEIQGGPPPTGLYQKMLSRASGDAPHRKQIEKDVHRTFGSVRGLRVPQQEALQSLRNVLLAYAEHNPQVGYCQSMNFIAAVLLLVVDEESAWWCLAAIVERLMPGHFSQCMAMAIVDQGVLSDFLRIEDGQLVERLEEMQVAPSLVTTQWLLTCFVGSSLPLNALLRVWDAFFKRRHVSFLFTIAAALLITNRAALLAARDTGEAYQVLTSLGHDLHTPEAMEKLLHAASVLSARPSLHPDELTSSRRRHAAKLEGERGLHAAQIAHAAVATATATANETQQQYGGVRRNSGSNSNVLHAAAAGQDYVRGEWTLVPVPPSSGLRGDHAVSPEGGRGGGGGGGGEAPASDLDEGWSLVERSTVGGGNGGGGAGRGAGVATSTVPPRQSLSYVILQLEAPKLLEGHFPEASRAEAAMKEAAARLDAMESHMRPIEDARASLVEEAREFLVTALSRPP